MTITSTTLAGVNVWQFSGNVTDAEIKTAWSALIVSGRYQPGRYIYIDNTCNLSAVRGGWYVDMQNLGFILHSSRNKANTVFANWFIVQTVGLSTPARSNFVRFTNGTTISNSVGDGIDMLGGAMVYDVAGNPGGADPRYLNEMMFGSIDGTLIVSQAFAEQEIQVCGFGGVWRGVRIQRGLGIPQLDSPSARHVVYRSFINTETSNNPPLSVLYGSCLCLVSTTVRRQGVAVTGALSNTYSSSASVIVLLNNFSDESFFGASKTSFTSSLFNWATGNRIIGGVLKKIQVQPSTLIRGYDSRSSTASQKNTFSETTSDFLAGTDSTTADAITGRATIVCVGAIATGGTSSGSTSNTFANVPITRYTGQKFTLQKFGYVVQVITPDMSTGDDDLSAFSPIVMTAQGGIARTQSAIQAATTVTNFQQALEELHLLAIGLVGADSYNAFSSGNLFALSGTTLTTSFATVNLDPSAASKIVYNSATNDLTLKCTTLAANSTVTNWVTGGALVLASGVSIDSASVTGNVQQATPTNMSGVTITGNLTFNTNTATTITLTNCAISGTVSNSGTALVTVVLAGTSTAGTAGANVSVQVQCSVARFGSGSFNLVARYGTTGAYTDLGYFTNQTAKTFTVPLGQPVELAMWSLGYLTYVRTFTTTGGGFSIKADMVTEPDVDTTLDVSVYLANITVSNAGGVFTVVFGADMAIPGLEAAKAIVHRLLALENAMRALLPPGSATIIDIEPDEIQINQPGVFLQLGTGVNDVSIAGYFNDLPAKAITPAYIINPRRVVDNLRVEIPLVKPALDIAAMAAASAAATRLELATELGRIDAAISTRSTLAAGAAMTLTAAYDAAKTAATQTSVNNLGSPAQATTLATLASINQAEHDATQTAIAALPAAPTAAANAAQVWGYATRTLTETPGLTTGQAEQLRKVAQLHGVGATLVVTETARTAGDVSQTITTTEEQTTVSAA